MRPLLSATVHAMASSLSTCLGAGLLLATFAGNVQADTGDTPWSLNGAVRARFDYDPDRDIRKAGLDTVMLGVNYEGDAWSASARYRWYGHDYPFAYVDWGQVRFIEHAWVARKLDADSVLKVGLHKVPFGLQPLFSSTFYETLGNVVGLEDVNLVGATYQHQGEGWNVQAGVYARPAWAGYGTSNGSTYSIVVTPADPGVAGGRSVRERNVLALRLAHELPVDEGSGEVGVSLYQGALRDTVSGDAGQRSALAVHLQRRSGNWETRALLARQRIAVPGGGQWLSFGGYDGTFNVASHGTLSMLDLSYHVPGQWLGGWVHSVRPYASYSRFDKSAPGFHDSERFFIGSSVSVRSVYVALEWMHGKNDPYLGGSSYTQSLAAGGINHWKSQLYMNVGYYF